MYSLLNFQVARFITKLSEEKNNKKETVKLSMVVYFPHKTASFYKHLRN